MKITIIIPSLYFKNIIVKCKDIIKFRNHKRVLKRQFYKLKWTQDDVWEMTKYSCGSLDEAIRYLSNKLMDDCKLYDYRLYPITKTLIKDGFKRSWK